MPNPSDINKDVTLGMIKGAGSTIMNLGKLGQQGLAKLTGVAPVGGQEQFDKFVGDTKNKYLTPKNTAQNVGYGLEQVAEFFIPGGAASNIATKAPKVMSTLTKLPGVAKTALKVLGRAGADVGVATAQSGGDIQTMKDAGAYSIGGSLVGGAVAKGLKNFGNLLFLRTIPGTPKQLANDLRKGIDIGEALSKTGVSFTKGQLLGKVAGKINTFTNQVDNLVSGAGGKSSRTFDEIADDAIKLINDQEIGAKLETTPINVQDVKTVISDTLNKYRKLYAGKTLDPAVQHQLKQDIGVGIGRAWDKMLTTPIRAEAFAESKIYSSLNSFLRKNIDGYESLNKQLAPLREATKRVSEKGPYSGYLTDVIAASMAGSTGGNIFEDPVGFFKNAISGVLLKRGLTSTAAKTLGGTLSKSLAGTLESPAFFQLLREITSSPKPKDQPTKLR
ncbi:MAG: hypothetical protein WCT03_26745 [Candidatus Obscuribacterales bacterium]